MAQNEIFGYGMCIDKIYDIDLRTEDNMMVIDIIDDMNDYCNSKNIGMYYNLNCQVPPAIFIGIVKYDKQKDRSPIISLDVSEKEIQELKTFMKVFEKELRNVTDAMIRWQTFLYNDF